MAYVVPAVFIAAVLLALSLLPLIAPAAAVRLRSEMYSTSALKFGYLFDTLVDVSFRRDQLEKKDIGRRPSFRLRHTSKRQTAVVAQLQRSGYWTSEVQDDAERRVRELIGVQEDNSFKPKPGTVSFG